MKSPSRKGMSAELQHLLMRDAIVVKQEVELANVIIGFDAANRYSLSDPSGEFIGSAAEQGGGVGGFLIRQFLNNNRPLTLHIYNLQGQEIAQGKKPFRFIFPEMTAVVDGQPLGRVRRRFKILKRKFTIEVGGIETFDIESSIFQLGKLTFDVTRNGQKVATISKNFEGFLKMAFTQADTFSIQFHDQNLTLQERFTLFITLFLIDYDVFEQR